MRYLYQYKTKDGERHDGEICAASREGVFAELKKKGIKPYGVVLAPGFVNWLQSLGKRTYAIVLLSAVVIVAVAYALRTKEAARTALRDTRTYEQRSQIYGDPAILRQCEAKEWANVFSDPLEQVLAVYAIPGRGVDYAAARGKARDVREPLHLEPVPVLESDSAEIASMKRMVNWMKRELSNYISDGGKFSDYVMRLQHRQNEECQIRGRIEVEMGKLNRQRPKFPTRAAFESAWEEKNEVLRTMGILPFPLPD